MERGNSKHNPRVDEQLSHEIQGVVQGTAGARAQEWKMAEPPGEDQPGVTFVPEGDYPRAAPAGVGNAESEALSRFGSYLGLSALPGDREALKRSAKDLNAPEDVLQALDRLPADTTFRTVLEVWSAVHQRA